MTFVVSDMLCIRSYKFARVLVGKLFIDKIHSYRGGNFVQATPMNRVSANELHFKRSYPSIICEFTKVSK